MNINFYPFTFLQHSSDHNNDCNILFVLFQTVLEDKENVLCFVLVPRK